MSPAARSSRAARGQRTAIVTGAASGIGRALAAGLVARGDHVVLADVDGPAVERAAAALTGPGSAEPLTLDVTDADAVAAACGGLAERHGRLDLVVNNAGIGTGGAAEELTLDHWRRTLAVNLDGVVHGVHAAYPLMLAQGGGQILNTASLAGLVPSPLMAPYTASKHAVVALSLALRAEAAGRRVRVSVLCPGFVDTPLLDRTNPGLPQTRVGADTRGFAHRFQRRFATPEQVADAALSGLARNRPVIVVPWEARVAWAFTRLSPRFPLAVGRLAAWRYRRELARG